MAKKTRTLTNEELRGFVDQLNRTRQFKANQQAIAQQRADNAAARAEAVPVAAAGGTGSGWDAALHVGGRALDILGAFGYGANRAAKDMQTNLEEGDIFGALNVGFGPGRAASVVAGATDAITGNQDALVHGHELIEHTKDSASRAAEKQGGPKYKDTADNVDPIAKGVGGFAIDVLNDPTTMLPAGPLAKGASAGLRASVDAARATKGGDVAKTLAFFNPVTATKGFGQGAKQGFTEAKDLLKGLAAKPEVQAAEAALGTAPRQAANLAAATGAKAPATAGRATKPDEVPINPAAAVPAAPTPAAGAADLVEQGAQRAAVGVPEGTRAAEATAAAAAASGRAARDAEEAAPLPPVSPEPEKVPVEAAAMDVVADTAEKSIRTQMAEQLAPSLARAANASGNTTEILANLRALTYTTNAYPARIQKQVEKLAPRPGDKAEAADWDQKVTELIGEDAVKTLRGITDPAEFTAKAKEIARQRIENTMDGKTPTDLFRKLGSRRNEFNVAKAREVAKLLGLKDIPGAKTSWTEFSDYLRRVNPKAQYDEMARHELSTRDLLAGTSLPGAGVAEAAAKEIDPMGARVKAAADADDLLPPEIAARIDDAIMRVFPADFEQTYRHVVDNPKTGESFHGTAPKFGDDFKGVNRYVFTQYHQLDLWKNLWEEVDKGFKGLPPAARQEALHGRFKDALTYADYRLKALGIAPVNGAMRKERDLLKTKGDYAFFSFGDLLNALPDEVGRALLFSGKDLNVPITMVSDLAREALRIAETQASTVDMATTLLHKLQQRLTKEFASGSKEVSALAKKFQRNPTLLKGLVGAISEPEFIQKLSAANARNLAFAVAVNGQKAARASEPILSILRRFALDPNVSTGKEIDAILAARDALKTLVRSNEIEDTPAEGLAETMLEKGTAEVVSTAKAKQARAALNQDRAVVDGNGQPVTDTAKKARKQKVDDAVAAAHAPGKEPTAPKGEPKTENAKKAEIKTREASNTARAAEHTQVEGAARQIVEALQKQGDTVVDDPVYEADAAFAAFTQDLPAWLRTAFKGAEKMDGWFGKRDVKPFAISAEMNSQNMMLRYSRALKAATEGAHVDHVNAAIAIFQRMDGNGGLDAVLTEGIAPEVADVARRLWPVFAQVFDHSDHSLLQRIGLDGAYLNDYLKRQGVPEAFLMGGSQTWENGTAWRHWNFANVADPLSLLDGYHRAIVRAQIVPDVAANFSAHFGNRSTVYGPAMSPEEARAAGWIKADTQSGRWGGLFTFLDKEQYYPKEMLTQLAVMDKYFAASRSLDQNTFFDRTFRYIDPITNSVKATITLWRPGHHMTNITGEALMNSLAGVVNPLDYLTAWRVLVGTGRADRKGMTELERYLHAAAPEGVQLKQAAGVPVNFRAQGVTSIDERQFHRLLEQNGVIVPVHQAEDLVQDGIEGAGRTSKDAANPLTPQSGTALRNLQKINRTIAPGWLSTFSANRDNFFRIAHAAKIVRTGNFDNLSQAAARMTEEINSFHPNMLTLSAGEQKYARRIIYFYTWQRQALTRVLTSMVDTPGRIMIAPKALYNIGVANGVEGQSWGEPVPDQSGIPSYLRSNVGQFMTQDPLTGDDEMGENYLWGTTINAPQLDIISSIFGSVNVDPAKPGWEQAGETAWQFTSKNVLQNLAPVFKVPIELGTHARLGTGTPLQEGEEGKYLLEQTGLRPLAVMGGALDDENDDPTVQQQKRETATWNYWTGLRRTLYDGPEQYDIWMRQEQEKARKAAEQ